MSPFDRDGLGSWKAVRVGFPALLNEIQEGFAHFYLLIERLLSLRRSRSELDARSLQNISKTLVRVVTHDDSLGRDTNFDSHIFQG